MSLFDEGSDSFIDAETTAYDQTVELETISYKRKKRKGRKAELTKELPCQIHLHDLDESEKNCDCCGTSLSKVGVREIRTEVEFIPVHLIKDVHQEQAYECRKCKVTAEKAVIKHACAPKPAIRNSLASPSILAWLCHQKIEMSLLFNRQEAEWSLYGLSVSRRTLANWFSLSVLDWLKPVYKQMQDALLSEEVLHADETSYQILNRSDAKVATSESRIWLFRNSQYASHPIILYHSTLTRSRSVASQFLSDFKGYLHCVGYAGYQKLSDILLVTCWAHLRRKFFEAGDAYGQSAIGLNYCNQLFALERDLKDLPACERLRQRQEKVKPVAEAFWHWLDSLQVMKGLLGKAVQYALNLKTSLMRFLSDGCLVMSNNLAEQAI